MAPAQMAGDLGHSTPGFYLEYRELMGRTRVLIVDDHERVRTALVAKLATNRNLQVAATAAATDADLLEAMRFEPDVVLLDVKRADESGVELCRKTVLHRPSARVLVLTSYPDETEKSEVRAAGAAGYLLKDLDLQELLRQIECEEPHMGSPGERSAV